MRIYIASKYIQHKELNRLIYSKLKKAGFDAFLPESINIDAINVEESYQVAEKCFYEIERCNVILAVCPFGKSVASELGYAIALKKRKHNKRIVSLKMDFKNEAMIAPYVDMNVESIDELIKYLKNIH